MNVQALEEGFVVEENILIYHEAAVDKTLYLTTNLPPSEDIRFLVVKIENLKQDFPETSRDFALQQPLATENVVSRKSVLDISNDFITLKINHGPDPVSLTYNTIVQVNGVFNSDNMLVDAFIYDDTMTDPSSTPIECYA